MTREQLERTRDAVYALACAVDDVERDLGEAPSEVEVREALAWLLGAARDVVDAG
ncbi:MAG TPA: hypothetical protein VFZ83_05390 [Acidimicrobiia bacterium]|nr:hypothetical protein [Acidimicrobiia bacterium]